MFKGIERNWRKVRRGVVASGERRRVVRDK